jgi:hypothetical protein
MIIADVLGELMAAVHQTGVHVPNQWGQRPNQPPMALVELPARVDFDAGGRGLDRIPDVNLVVLVGAPDNPDAFRAAAPYLDGTGPRSVKQAMESYRYTSCSTVRVAWAEPTVATLQADKHLALIFHIDVTGSRGDPGGRSRAR